MKKSQVHTRNTDNCDIEFTLKHKTLTIRVKSSENVYYQLPAKSQNGASDSNFVSGSQESISQQKIDSQVRIGVKKEMKKYKSEFCSETLPSECKMWVKNIVELFEMLISEEACEISKNQQGLQVGFKLLENRHGNMFVRNGKFSLPLFLEKQEDLLKYEESSESNQISQLNSNKNSEMDDNKKEDKLILNQYSKQISKLKEDLKLSVKNSESAKKSAEDVKLFVECFISQIQQKWSKVIQQFVILKQKRADLTERVQNIQRNKIYCSAQKVQKLKQIKCTYKLSQKYKEKSILSIQHKIARSQQQSDKINAVLIEPTTFLTKKNSNSNQFRVQIKINRITKYIALGVCQKQVLKALSFQFFQENKKHGCYILQSNGQIQSNYCPRKKSLNKEFQFKQNDIIILTFKSHRKILSISKKGKPGSIQMMIDPIIPLNQLCFFALLSGAGEQIQILKQTVIDLDQNN